MDKKGILSTTALPLFALTLLTASLIGVSAVPTSPYIMVVPEKTLDSTLTPGNTYSISIYTDYTGSDIWSWQFELTFNPAVLQGVTVTNGDLITTIKDPSALFQAGTFDNTLGRLSLTYAWFDYSTPPAPTTSGPGTLAYVEFTVIGYGSSDIMLLGEGWTILMGPDYNIIDGYMQPDSVGHGFFSNKLVGDANSDRQVDVLDLFELGKAYESASTEPNYNSDCDFNHDFRVNSTDLSGLRSNYGESI